MRTRHRLAAMAVAAALAGTGIAGVTTAEAAQTPAKPYDFNGDGYQDLALGNPYGDVGSTVNAGFVSVVYGSATGLVPARHTNINQNTAGIPGAPEAEDLFGYALASADFNRDGFADLAVGIPGEDIEAGANGGYYNVIWGTRDGLTGSGALAGVEPGPAAGHNFGTSMTTGDFDDDGVTDLVITATGTPDFYWFSFAELAVGGRGLGKAMKADVRLPSEAKAAAATPGVNAFYVAAGDVTGDDIDDLAVGWRDDDAFLPEAKAGFTVWAGSSDGTLTGGDPVAAEGIGSIAVGDFQGDGNADVAVGQTTDSPRLGGQVAVYAGNADGVSAPPAYVRYQGSGIPGTAKAGDGIGWSLAVGDANNDGKPDLAIGAPLKDVGTLADAGQTVMLYGATGGLANARVFNQDTGAIPGTTEAGDQFGYNVALIDHNNNTYADLSIGIPRENGYEGYMVVLPGTANGITDVGSIGFGTTVLGISGTTAQLGLRIGRL